MTAFSNLNLSGSPPLSLVWRQPRFSEDHYELSDDTASNALYATLGWPKWLSDLAVARSAAGTWYFDRLGWTRRTISVTRMVKRPESSDIENQSSGENIANFEAGWLWEGNIVLSNSEVFHWFRTKYFRNAWALTEVIADPDSDHHPGMGMMSQSATKERKRKGFHPGRWSKPSRKERLLFEIEFGHRWFKREAWISLPTHQAAQHPELTFLLCAGMYLGYCYEQDSAAAVVVSTTAAVS